MARARNIKPGFFLNDGLSELPYEARLLFIGLWTIADRSGRLEDRPKRIKGALFPYDDVDIEPLLQLLYNSQERFIVRYEADGKRYIQVTNFRRHQNPHKNEAESAIPAPVELPISEVHSTNTVQVPEEQQSNHAESLLLNPDSLIPESLTEPPLSPTRGEDSTVGFDDFWKAYPKKVGKGEARKVWNKVKPSKKLIQIILEAIPKAQQSEQWKREGGRYIPNPSTWLNQGRWDDELPAGVSDADIRTTSRTKNYDEDF